jgi:tetratricopeptide (TPR) repeat protein
VLASYAGALGFPPVFDDGIVAEAPWREVRPRALAHASFALTVALAGLDVRILRLENLLLHAGTALALFAFCRNLLGLRRPASGGAPREAIAFAAAAVFALHPVTVYAVGYVAQRTIVMATLFSVLSLNTWLLGLTTSRRRWFVASVVLYGLAILCKEHAVMLPALAAALTLAMRSEARELRVPVIAALAAGVLITVLVVLGARVTIGTAYEPDVAQVMGTPGADLLWRSVLTQALLFFRYGLIWCLPLPAWMSVDLRWPLAPSSFDPAGLAALLAFAVYGAVALRLVFARGQPALVGFALLWPWLLYFTEFAVVRAQEPFVLYRSYLWAPGLVILAAMAFGRLPARALGWSALAVCLALSLVMRERLSTFASDLALWDDAVRKLPADPAPFADRAISNRGLALLYAGRRAEALRDFDVAIGLNPASTNAYANRAALYSEVGDVARAEADLGEAVRLQPRFPEAYAARCGLRVLRGDVDAARLDCDTAFEQEPRLVIVRVNRALLFAASGQLGQAKGELDAVIAAHPGHALALMHRGLLNERLGRAAEARADLGRACRAGLRAACRR